MTLKGLCHFNNPPKTGIVFKSLYLCSMHKISTSMQPDPAEIGAMVDQMRAYFDNGRTLDIAIRKSRLIALAAAIEKYKADICAAAYDDFHKPEAEVLLTEVYPVLAEIKHTVSNLSSWARSTRVKTNLLLLPSSSRIHHSPKGMVVIFAPWNYSFWLSMMPFVSAIGAGNVVVLKPAHETPAISSMIQKIISEVFDPNHASVILGEGALAGSLLLDHFVWDHIFFTGSARVGKWIMEKAAQNLSAVTLELGGKSPAILDDHYNLKKAARKIMWGKIINAGQTCVSSDYVLVPKHRVEAFTAACIEQIQALVGENALESEQYSHIINTERFDRLISLLQGQQILFGGKYNRDSRCIEPTLILPSSLDAPVMSEEIFGPILPIVAYENKEQLLEIIRKNRYPLSLYLFVDDSSLSSFILERVEFGSGCFNNTIYQLGNPNLPFGGIRSSGQGTYHGRTGFETFSNNKSVLHSPKWFDLDLLYQPYTKAKLRIIKWFFMN